MDNFLGIGTALFIIGGVFDMFIGVMTPIVTRVFGLAPIGAFLTTARGDTKMLGVAPKDLVDRGDPAAELYRLMIDLVGGLIVTFGLMQVCIAWFALRRGQTWALWTLVAADLVFAAGWLFVLVPYYRKGIALGFGDLPPNFWVPTILLLPAALLSYLGLRQPGQ